MKILNAMIGNGNVMWKKSLNYINVYDVDVNAPHGPDMQHLTLPCLRTRPQRTTQAGDARELRKHSELYTVRPHRAPNTLVTRRTHTGQTGKHDNNSHFLY